MRQTLLQAISVNSVKIITEAQPHFALLNLQFDFFLFNEEMSTFLYDFILFMETKTTATSGC